ncbi:MAG TPA: 16S rRNA (cytosine(1402)-N(4))-methyltransferase RsmH [Flavobacteriales bacterium]|nr:16S rRNA (cytosine(1402)-N(4))-methyltransferase RsmH [Flavobacteriales bacterium]HIN38956.1 16S rRNA (cytosine(1402)-N(4))-methyltransferase RsmH [Flavobacteriales bacterium]
MQYHVPVLLNESVGGLEVKADGVYVDVTFGGGGHAAEILKRIKTGRLIAFDRDKEAIKNKMTHKRFQLVNQNFIEMKSWLLQNGVGQIDGLIADLGISSHQIDTAERGFSTRYNSDLDMRMDHQTEFTAKDVLNKYSEKDLVKIFRSYGEIINATSLAKALVQVRLDEGIGNVDQFKSVLRRFAKRGKENKFFAQVFQALRIEVNDELSALKELLQQSASVIKKGGRLVVISYHSLEDRLVKRFVESGKFEGEVDKDFYGNPIREFKAITRKPIVPSKEELLRNSRARSAKLRIAEKL